MDEKRLKEIQALPAMWGMADSDDRSENYLVGREMASAIRELLDERRQTLLQVDAAKRDFERTSDEYIRNVIEWRKMIQAANKERDDANRQVSELKVCIAKYAEHKCDCIKQDRCVCGLMEILKCGAYEPRLLEKPKPEVCGTWVIGVGPCCATLPCVHHPRQAEKRIEEPQLDTCVLPRNGVGRCERYCSAYQATSHDHSRSCVVTAELEGRKS